MDNKPMHQEVHPAQHTHQGESTMANGTKPRIAVVSDNTLTALGLSALMQSMMPMLEVCVYHGIDDFREGLTEGEFFHYFVSTRVLLADVSFFIHESHRTIVIVEGDDTSILPARFHTLNATEPEDKLVRSIMQLAHSGHKGKSVPEAAHPTPPPCDSDTKTLTPREREVLRLVVKGMINKEIAATLNVGLSTIITHRKNITEKLGMKSVSALTIYAVVHGIVELEGI